MTSEKTLNKQKKRRIVRERVFDNKIDTISPLGGLRYVVQYYDALMNDWEVDVCYNRYFEQVPAIFNTEKEAHYLIDGKLGVIQSEVIWEE